MAEIELKRRISDLEPGDYEVDKEKVFIPGSLGQDKTFRYPLDAMQKAAEDTAKTMVSKEATDRESVDRTISDRITREIADRQKEDAALGERIDAIPPSPDVRSALGVPIKTILHLPAQLNPHTPSKEVFYYVGNRNDGYLTVVDMSVMANLTGSDIGKIYTFITMCGYESVGFKVHYALAGVEGVVEAVVSKDDPLSLMFVGLRNNIPRFAKV